MKFTLESTQGILIHSYQAGELTLKVPTDNPARPYEEQRYRSSLILSQSNTVTDWPVNQPGELQSHHFEAVWQAQPGIVLLGTGQRLVFPGMDIRQAFALKGIGFEAMDTSAACRTYNVLAAEGRDVMALLILD